MASDDDLTDTSATGLFNWSSDRVEAGWKTAKFVKTGIGLMIAGVSVGIYRVWDSVINFVTSPLNTGGDVVSDLFEGLVGEPIKILVAGSDASATGIPEIFTGWLSPAAFAVSVASVLGGLWVLSLYLEERETSDIFPGSFTDIDTPEWVPIVGDPGVKEEGETDDARD